MGPSVTAHFPQRARRRKVAPLTRALAVVTLALALGTHTGAARAHTQTSTFGDLVVAADQVTWTLRVRVVDLLAPLGLDEHAGVSSVLDRAAAASAYVARHLSIEESGDACLPTVEPARADPSAPEPSVAIVARFHCPRRVVAMRAHQDLFFDLDDRTSGFTSVHLDHERTTTFIFRKNDATLTMLRPLSPWQEMRDYLKLGVEHIFTGYDHLAFLSALLLGAALATRSGRGAAPIVASPRAVARTTLAIVTSFTAAHSITLIASALHPGFIRTGWVEPAIALSVAWVGVENLLPSEHPRRRWPLAFAFGLVHGFGFASALREIGLPRAGLVRSLLAFNLGVELGQLVVVLIVVPVLMVLARRGGVWYERWIVKGGSLVLAVMGMIWFFWRAFG